VPGLPKVESLRTNDLESPWHWVYSYAAGAAVSEEMTLATSFLTLP